MMDEMQAIAEFEMNALRDMDARLMEGVRRGWGTTWKTNYPDSEASQRLARAVEHLEVALSNYRLGIVGPDEMCKRAADVANQAFFLADPDRLEANRG